MSTEFICGKADSTGGIVDRLEVLLACYTEVLGLLLVRACVDLELKDLNNVAFGSDPELILAFLQSVRGFPRYFSVR